MKVIMLVGNDDSSVYMYNGLRNHVDIIKVIIEDKPNKWTMISRRARKLGYWQVLGQLIFIVYSRLLGLLSKKKIRTLEKNLNLSRTEIGTDKVIRVESVNSPKTKQLLGDLQPDIIVVNGTRIISADVLNCVKAKFLNTHLGITPKYRGVHGGYWALANGDRQRFGTTVHLVDPGIDTGEILRQGTTHPGKCDNFCTYPLHQIAIGIKLMRLSLTDLKCHQMEVGSCEQKSILWHHPDILTYLKNWIAKGVK